MQSELFRKAKTQLAPAGRILLAPGGKVGWGDAGGAEKSGDDVGDAEVGREVSIR